MDDHYDDRELDGGLGEGSARWPLGWQGLYPRERWLWFEDRRLRSLAEPR